MFGREVSSILPGSHQFLWGGPCLEGNWGEIGTACRDLGKLEKLCHISTDRWYKENKPYLNQRSVLYHAKAAAAFTLFYVSRSILRGTCGYLWQSLCTLT